MTYTHQPYPKAVYSPTGEMRIVKDEKEHMEVLEKWTSPADDDVSTDEDDQPKRPRGRPRKNP